MSPEEQLNQTIPVNPNSDDGVLLLAEVVTRIRHFIKALGSKAIFDGDAQSRENILTCAAILNEKLDTKPICASSMTPSENLLLATREAVQSECPSAEAEPANILCNPFHEKIAPNLTPYIYSTSAEEAFTEIKARIGSNAATTRAIDDLLVEQLRQTEEYIAQIAQQFHEQQSALADEVASAVYELHLAAESNIPVHIDQASLIAGDLMRSAFSLAQHLLVESYATSNTVILSTLILACRIDYSLVSERVAKEASESLGIEPLAAIANLPNLRSELSLWAQDICSSLSFEDPRLADAVRWFISTMSTDEAAVLAERREVSLSLADNIMNLRESPSWESAKLKLAESVTAAQKGYEKTVSELEPTVASLFQGSYDFPAPHAKDLSSESLNSIVEVFAYTYGGVRRAMLLYCTQLESLRGSAFANAIIKSETPKRLYSPFPRNLAAPEESFPAETPSNTNSLDLTTPESTSQDATFFHRLSVSFDFFSHERKYRKDFKSRRKQIKKDTAQLKRDEDTYYDNLYIMAHYEEIIPEQEQIILNASASLKKLRPQLLAAEAAAAAATAALMAAKRKASNAGEDGERNYSGEIAAKSAAATAAGAAVAKLASDVSREEKAIKNAEDRIRHCDYVMTHPEETPALKKKIEQDKLTLAGQQNEADAIEQHIASLGEGSNLAKTFLVAIIGALCVIFIVIALVVSFSIPHTTSGTSSKSSYSTSQSKSSSSSSTSKKSSSSSTSSSSSSGDGPTWTSPNSSASSTDTNANIAADATTNTDGNMDNNDIVTASEPEAGSFEAASTGIIETPYYRIDLEECDVQDPTDTLYSYEETYYDHAANSNNDKSASIEYATYVIPAANDPQFIVACYFECDPSENDETYCKDLGTLHTDDGRVCSVYLAVNMADSEWAREAADRYANGIRLIYGPDDELPEAL